MASKSFLDGQVSALKGDGIEDHMITLDQSHRGGSHISPAAPNCPQKMGSTRPCSAERSQSLELGFRSIVDGVGGLACTEFTLFVAIFVSL